MLIEPSDRADIDEVIEAVSAAREGRRTPVDVVVALVEGGAVMDAATLQKIADWFQAFKILAGHSCKPPLGVRDREARIVIVEALDRVVAADPAALIEQADAILDGLAASRWEIVRADTWGPR